MAAAPCNLVPATNRSVVQKKCSNGSTYIHQWPHLYLSELHQCISLSLLLKAIHFILFNTAPRIICKLGIHFKHAYAIKARSIEMVTALYLETSIHDKTEVLSSKHSNCASSHVLTPWLPNLHKATASLASTNQCKHSGVYLWLKQLYRCIPHTT